MAPSQALPITGDPLRYWSRLTPRKTALAERNGGRRWSYEDLSAEADRWAAALREMGIERGDRVAVLAANRAELVHLFFACGRLGCALVPLNWRLAPSELGQIIKDAKPALLLAEPAFAAGITGDWTEVDEMRRRAEIAPAAPGVGALHSEAPDPETPWLILYTSGSTGTPKGAILPHRQILYNALATCSGWQLSAADVAPISTPLFHTGGWNVFATPLWFAGGTVVLFEGFEAEEFLTGLAEAGCTMALTVPTQLLMLTESPGWGMPLPRLRAFISGGAPCPGPLAASVRAAGYGFREGYGLTECGPNCFATTDAIAASRPGSVGLPIPFLEIRLEGEDGGEAGAGEPGEILLRGPQLFAGYLGRPELTAAAIDAEGWLRTGDLAQRGEDGIHRICGRRKEMFISGGENVYPGEVEAALCEMAGVQEAVVVGVPDARWGEVGRAFVVARQGASLRESDVLAHARERLAGYKRPACVRIVSEIPRLGSGKPDRRALSAENLQIAE
jgi:fatty-acyl-CoA synthase